MNEKTRADSVNFFLTYKAAEIGIDIADITALAPPFTITPTETEVTDDGSLGGSVSAVKADQAGFYVTGSLRNIKILFISGENSTGLAGIEAVDSDSLRFTAPSGTPGEAVTIANGETKLLEDGAEPSKYALIQRTSADDLKGSLTITILPIFNNVIGMSNVSGAEQQAGEIKLRCIAIKNVNNINVSNLKIWLKTLGTQQVSDSDQLASSGAGTLETTGTFADWPKTGFCRIETSGDSLREIVYYSSRTDSALTVPAAGRGLLESSASAGVNTDKIYPVPGIKIANQSPDGGGNFSLANDENDTDAVSGLSWTTGITAETGLDMGTIEPSAITGLWIWLIVTAGQTAAASLENALNYSFDVGEGEDEISVTGRLGGKYRIADDTIEGYELYRGVDSEPDLTGTPWATFTELPYESEELDAGHTYYFVTRFRNKYNLVSQNITIEKFEIDAEGNEVQPLPDAPANISITPAAAGKAIVEAQYLFDPDDIYAATKWIIYFTDDGSDPDPDVDNPTVVTMSKNSTGSARLRWTSPAADNEDTLKVIVRVRRTDDETDYDSTNTDIYSAAASTEGPQKVSAKALIGRTAESK